MIAFITPRRLVTATSGPGFKAFSVVVLVSLLTTLLTYVGIRASLRFGRLSIPPTYDDVVYFLSAAKWMSAWPARSVAGSLHALLGEHAPFSTITAVAGFLLTPDSYVGHYAINAVVIATFMFGIAALVWESNLLDIFICLGGVACFPLMVQVVNEARPDLPWGLVSGLAIGALVNRPIHRRSLRAVAALGFCCGLAALIKPSALPASLVCFTAAFVISTLAGWSDQNNPSSVRNAAWRALIFGLAMIFALAPYLSISFSDIAGYIWRTLVEDRGFWAFDASPYDHAVFYSFGGGGHIALNRGLLAGLGLFAIRFALGAYLKSRDWIQALALLTAAAVTYAIPSVSPVKSYFLGAMFYGTFVVSTALNFAAVVAMIQAATRDRRLGQMSIFNAFRAVAMATLVGIFLFGLFLRDAPLETVFDEGTRRQTNTASETVWPVLRVLAVQASNAGKQPPLVSFSSPFPVNPTLMELYAQQAQTPLNLRGDFFYRSLDDYMKSLTSVDLVVVTSSIPHNLPVPRMGDDIIRALDRRSDLCVILTVSRPNDPILRLYRKADEGCSVQAD
jgi:hypothetical protein